MPVMDTHRPVYRNAAANAALVVSLVAFAVSVAAMHARGVWLLAVPVAAVGLTLGFAGLVAAAVNRAVGVAQALAGTAISTVALLLCLIAAVTPL